MWTWAKAMYVQVQDGPASLRPLLLPSADKLLETFSITFIMKNRKPQNVT